MTSFLDDFQDNDRALIVSMPVRIGYWMSGIDDVAGTERDDEKEALALERAVKAVFQKTGDKAFSNDVAEFALSSRADWPAWKETASTVLDDLPRLLKLVRATLPADAAKGYAKSLYYIATVVAQAASEDGGEDDLSREVMGSGLLNKILDRLSVKTDASVPENVSAREKAALQKLLEVLKG